MYVKAPIYDGITNGKMSIVRIILENGTLYLKISTATEIPKKTLEITTVKKREIVLIKSVSTSQFSTRLSMLPEKLKNLQKRYTRGSKNPTIKNVLKTIRTLGVFTLIRLSVIFGY